MITFIVYIRKDSDERTKNLNLVLPYYTNLFPDAKFIFVEDSSENYFSYLKDKKNTKYISVLNDGQYNKSKSYNVGLAYADTDIVCFLDIDCIVSKENIQKGITTSLEYNNICIGYNGVSIYFTYKTKNSINESDNLYDYLDCLVDKSKLYLNYENEYYLVGNLKAVGGCLIGRDEVFKEINGFNPNIIGWGYEDNEIIKRALKLEIDVCYINTSKPYLFHLPHGVDGVDKSKHEHYEENFYLYNKVCNSSKLNLEEYIKTWSLI